MWCYPCSTLISLRPNFISNLVTSFSAFLNSYLLFVPLVLYILYVTCSLLISRYCQPPHLISITKERPYFSIFILLLLLFSNKTNLKWEMVSTTCMFREWIHINKGWAWLGQHSLVIGALWARWGQEGVICFCILSAWHISSIYWRNWTGDHLRANILGWDYRVDTLRISDPFNVIT